MQNHPFKIWYNLTCHLDFTVSSEISQAEPNLYKKPPIYRQRGEKTLLTFQELFAPYLLFQPCITYASPTVLSESALAHRLSDDPIVESSKFPAAKPPDPNQPAKIETDYWPCPPSLACVGKRDQQFGIFFWHRTRTLSNVLSTLLLRIGETLPQDIQRRGRDWRKWGCEGTEGTAYGGTEQGKLMYTVYTKNTFPHD